MVQGRGRGKVTHEQCLGGKRILEIEKQFNFVNIQALFHKPILDFQIHASSRNDPGRKFDHYSFFETPKVLLLAWDRVSKIKDAFGNKQYKPEDIQELFRKLFNDVQNIHEELAEYINTLSWNRPAFYNNDEDDDEDYTIAITLDVPIMDSLIMEDEHLGTILEIESDKLIKSSVENLVPNLSESEGLSEDLFDIENKCDMPVCDDFTTFSNSLFDADDKFSSSDDESFSDEDVPKEIYSNPLFDEEIISIKKDPHQFNAESDLIESLLNQDSLIISSPKFDFLLEEFSGELAHIDLIPLGINEADFDPEKEIRPVEKLLYDNSSPRPPKEFNSDAIIESFSPSPISVEGDILFFEELVSYDSSSLPDNESFHFDVPSSPRPPAKPPNDEIYFEPFRGILTTKVVGNISEHYVLMPRLLPIQPTLCPVIDTSLPFSSENKVKVHLLSHRGFKAFQLFLKAR
nr:hypothetical protein [Tanacetum cinerariifolium]